MNAGSVSDAAGGLAASGSAPTTAPSAWADTALRQLASSAQAIATQWMEAAPDDLISLCVSVSPPPADAARAIGGDTHWRAPHDVFTLNASERAAHYAGATAIADYRRDLAQWRCWGDSSVPPVALFTSPPATEPTWPSIWLPRVVLRRTRDGAHLMVSARRGHDSVRCVIDGWLTAASRLLTPPQAPDARWSRIASQIATPDNDTWRARVQAARSAIHAGRLDKVVLARRVQAHLSAPVDIGAALRRLARMYPGCHVICLPHGDGRVVAASPEPLVLKRGDTVVAHALAGTVQRGNTPLADAQAVAALQASTKEQHEHALVVEAIRNRLAAICRRVEPVAAPAVLPLRFVQHLWTPVHGQLRADVDLFDTVLALHPTPAVLGLPADAARAWLAQHGERRDSLYTGVTGWVDRNGDGEAMVLLRSAWLTDDTAVLWAGAGIMTDSDPDAELAETEMKLKTMLEILSSAP